MWGFAAQPSKKNLELYISKQKKEKLSVLFLKRLDAPKHLTQFTWKFSQPLELQMILSKKWSRSMEMRYFWIADQVSSKEYTIHWHQGQENVANYSTKHHPATHYTQVGPYYLHMDHSQAYILRAAAPSVILERFKTYAHMYGSHACLPILLVVNDTQAMHIDTKHLPNCLLQTNNPIDCRLLLWIISPIFNTGCYAVLNRGVCVLNDILALKKTGVFVASFIKKNCFGWWLFRVCMLLLFLQE